MKLVLKQRLFSWFDSYDIYNENEETVYTVKGQLSIKRQTRMGSLAGDIRQHGKQGRRAERKGAEIIPYL